MQGLAVSAPATAGDGMTAAAADANTIYATPDGKFVTASGEVSAEISLGREKGF